MGFIDLIAFPLYVLIFYYLFAAYRKKINDPVLMRYHLIGFWIKILGTLAFTVFNLYLSQGDSFLLYHAEGTNMKDLILKDPGYLKFFYESGKDFDQTLLRNELNRGYFNDENNYMVAKLTTFCSFFTFNRYLLNNLFFSMISFTGVWHLFRFFYDLYPKLHKQIAIAVLFLPNFVFWSSGVLKDPICTGALGWITYALYEVLVRKKKLFKNSLVLFIAGYFLSVLKLYILVSYIPIFTLFIVLKNISFVNSKLIRIFLVPVLLIGSVALFIQISKNMEQEMDRYAISELAQSMSKIQGAYSAVTEGNDSQFSLGVDFDGSPASLLKMAPAAIIATLFRPFIWEVRKVSQLLSAFESLAVLLFTIFTLWKVGIKFFFRNIIKDPAILYCFLFAILFALFVGATTPNFGTLVRYKIPAMPFYVLAIFLIRNNYDLLLKSKLKANVAVTV
ncbi:MAG: hypothetical protein ABI685_00240 [Ferruginibacter sp.]